MYKALSAAFFLFVPLEVFSSQLETAALGETTPYAEPFEVEVTVIEKVKGLIYWAEPQRTDSLGVNAVKKYIADSKTINYMPSPFVFQIRLAGVRDEVNEGADLTRDDYYKQANKTINQALEGNKYRARCYGQYTNTVVPYCDLHDSAGQSPAVFLVRNGLLVPDSLLGSTVDSEKRALDAAVEAAKNDQIGMWKPFHGMLRGLQ